MWSWNNHYICRLRGGSGLSRLKTRFWAMGWWWLPGNSSTSWGWFWVHACNTASEQKIGQKPKTKRNEIELSFLCNFSRQTEQFGVVRCQNRIKMAKLCPFKVNFNSIFDLCPFKESSWPILGWKLAIVYEIWTSNLFSSLFTLILGGKPNWKSIGPILTILSSYSFPWISLKLSESM